MREDMKEAMKSMKGICDNKKGKMEGLDEGI